MKASWVEIKSQPLHKSNPNESLAYAIIGPARIVDEIGENEFSGLVRGRGCRDGNKYDNERDQGGVEGYVRNRRKTASMAVEDKGKQIGELVSDHHMPWLNHTGKVVASVVFRIWS